MVMQRMIAIDCLTCGHCSSIAAEKLEHFGLSADVSLVTLSKRLICKECGSRAVRTFRYGRESDPPPLVPED